MCCPHHWRVRLCKRCSGGRCWTRTDGTSHWPGTFCWRWRPRSVGPDHCPPAPGCRWSSPSCRSAQTESSPACHPAGLVQKIDMTQNMKLWCQINSVSNPPIIPYEHTVRLRISRLSFSRSENYIWFQRVVWRNQEFHAYNATMYPLLFHLKLQTKNGVIPGSALLTIQIPFRFRNARQLQFQGQ